MDKNFKSVLSFQNYKVESIDFKWNSKFKSGRKKIPISFDLEHAIVVQKKDNKNEGVVRLVIHMFRDLEPEEIPFQLKVSLVGIFESNVLDDEKFKKMLEVNGTAIMFPFLRAAVADITKTVNTNSLLLPLINVHKYLENKEKQKIEADIEADLCN